MKRRSLLAACFVAVFAVWLNASVALAQDKMPVIATFSILGDLVKNVGGDRIEVGTLVGSNADAHVYAPTPADAKRVGRRQGGVHQWSRLRRLDHAAGEGLGHQGADHNGQQGNQNPEDGADDHGHGHAATDPHAWQSVTNAKIYVATIRDGLIAADPAGKSTYEANASAYLAKLDALEAEVQAVIGKIPPDRRRIITSHDAFGYFGAAYGIEFIAPTGVSTEAAVSARDVAKIIAQIRKQKIPAVFMENVTDPRMMEQIAKESGAKIGGRLFSDALSAEKGPAPSYIEMMREQCPSS